MTRRCGAEEHGRLHPVARRDATSIVAPSQSRRLTDVPHDIGGTALVSFALGRPARPTANTLLAAIDSPRLELIHRKRLERVDRPSLLGAQRVPQVPILLESQSARRIQPSLALGARPCRS
jgi:hypothetical protein